MLIPKSLDVQTLLYIVLGEADCSSTKRARAIERSVHRIGVLASHGYEL